MKMKLKFEATCKMCNLQVFYSAQKKKTDRKKKKQFVKICACFMFIQWGAVVTGY